MMLTPDALEASAVEQTGLSDFGDGGHREGLERLTDSLRREAELTPIGEAIITAQLTSLLTSRLGIEDTYRLHPEIADEQIEGPLFVVGLPRTGTTALSQLLSADPQVRFLRMWESGSPVPPPDAATQYTDPRIAKAEASTAVMYDMFPRMRQLYNAEATAASECQDLMGMSFRTFHFDGSAHVPTYTSWVLESDMASTYAYHRRVAQLLQWHCPPNLWHFKTPVHLFSLDDVIATYPNAKFLWSHRDPAAVLGSVCDLVHYIRSWTSDRDDSRELGATSVAAWTEAVRRAMDFRQRLGDERFADISFSDLQTDQVGALHDAHDHLGIPFTPETEAAVRNWADTHPPGKFGQHSFDLEQFGLTESAVRASFAQYIEHFVIPTTVATI